jgi:hypothetical protein
MPAGICTDQVRDHFTAVEQAAEVQRLRERTYELVEFLHEVLQVDVCTNEGNADISGNVHLGWEINQPQDAQQVFEDKFNSKVNKKIN